MNRVKRFGLLASFLAITLLTNCSDNTPNEATAKNGDIKTAEYKEGSDYVLFQRVRILDKTGFETPAEAYSLLIPKGWQEESDVIWNMPGNSCSGTFKSFTAKSPDGQFRLNMYPDMLYTWNTDPQVNQFNQNSSSPNCAAGEPMNAEEYLKNIFATKELENAEVVKVESNPLVVEEMQQSNDKARQELISYGATNLQFYQTAVNATVRFADKSEALVLLGVTVLENTVPNIYNGSSTKIFTTQVTKRTVFRYPASAKDQAVNQFALIMGSFRTNQAWSDAVNKFWKDIRQQRQVAHIGKLKMMDAQTRAIGEQAIRNGQNRLNDMDDEMRSWEARQSSNDRMHTNFIKTIREVENYQDASGKVELSSGYNHAWSRNDGSSFIVSNNPNFNPAAVLQDQNWKEMKKVD